MRREEMIGERYEERFEKGNEEIRKTRKGGKSEKVKDNPKFVQERSADYPNRYKGELAPERDIEQIRPGNYKDDRYK